MTSSSGTSPLKRLYGTDQAAQEPRRLDVGPWSFEVRDGGLATVWADGAEVARGIAFVARDADWASPPPTLEPPAMDCDADRIVIEQEGRFAFGGGELDFRLTIRAEAAGTLSIAVSGTARGDVLTNRTGFVVLHPIAGVAGTPVAVTHADRSSEQDRFPEDISPGQPVFDIVALEHDLPGGPRVRIAFEGGAWEMEDHRNWSDASYKTYFRSLLDPYPYTIAAGDSLTQCVTLEIVRSAGPASVATDARVSVVVGGASGESTPAIAIALHPDRPQDGTHVARELGAMPDVRAVVWLEIADRARLDVGLGHLRAVASAGASMQLEVLFPDDVVPGPALAEIAEVIATSGAEVVGAVGLPRAFLASYQPSAEWPSGLQPEDALAALREALPGVPIGYGVLTYFTELNRRPPRTDQYDFINHATAAIVHDADDRAVMQTLEAIDQIAASARRMAGPDRGYHLGPSVIGMRTNPYGAATLDNPLAVRCAMAHADPRHRGLFGAAFALGVAAAARGHGVGQLCLGELAGPLGLMDASGAHYPLYHVVRGLARAAGTRTVEVEVGDPSRLAALAWRTEGGLEIWVANLTPDSLALDLRLPGTARAAVLDSEAYDRACSSAEVLDEPSADVPDRLGAYAVARVVTA